MTRKLLVLCLLFCVVIAASAAEEGHSHGAGDGHNHGHGEGKHAGHSVCTADANCTVAGCTCMEGFCTHGEKLNATNSTKMAHEMCAEKKASTNTSDTNPECFPSDASVTVESGVSKHISELNIGEKVLVSTGTFSEVIMFTHSDASARSQFVELTTDANKIQLSPGHYIYASGSLVAAKEVRVGDVLSLANGSEAAVRSVRVVTKDGLYNPQTVQGDIVVNGVKASTYTTAVEPKAAHSLLAPVRLLNSLVGGGSA